MKIRNALVVYKKSAYQVYVRERGDKNFIRLIRERHGTVKRFLKTHETHSDSLEVVQKILKSRGIKAHFVYRAHRFSEKKVDLVITVGGDGTFLEASHKVKNVPILGVNSSPGDSVGMFCGATAGTLERCLDDIISNRVETLSLTRLKVRLGGKVVPFYVLNDILVAHANAAATSRYLIRWGRRFEEHKSSGIWISPAAGSTAAIGAAGGTLLPIRSTKFQFLVREVYRSRQQRFRLTKGIIPSTQLLWVASKMRAGRVYLDGPHWSYPFPIGTVLEVTPKAPPLHVFHYNEKRRREIWA